MKASISERFWAKVKRGGPDECWPWLGSTGSKGHGSFWMNGRLRKAAQVSWEMANGCEFPADKMACHTCDNPPCVNPEHIWPGTNSDNMKDAWDKGRLRSLSRWLWTKCKLGHEFTPENTIIRTSGHRICRQCRDRRNRERFVRNPEYASALAEEQAWIQRNLK